MADIILPNSNRSTVASALTTYNGTGNNIICPSGTVDWSGGDLTLSGCSLTGPGAGAGSPLNITGGRIVIDKHATQITRLIGMRFTTDGHHIAIGGNPANQPYVVGDCYLFNNGSVMASMTTNGGLWYEVTFDAPTAHQADTFAINLGGVGTEGEDSWQAATTFGMDDSTGYVNNYFEDCVWNGFTEVALDNDNGARTVVRYSILNDSSFVQHGGGNGAGGQDTSAYGGRQLEIYNCTFNRVTDSVSMNKWVWMRGSSGVFANNAVDNNDTPDYPDKNNLRFSVGCPANPGYPMAYQFGQTTQTPDATPNQSYLIFGNTGTATTAPTWIVISGDSGGGITCSVPSTYIQSGRDYQTSNTWGWVPYTYPHPLRNSSPAGAGTLNATTANIGTLTVGA